MADEVVLVLTTREYEWWPSLQEIIPAVENVWTGVGRSGRADVRTVRVPLTADLEHELRAGAPQWDRVVLTAATPGTVQAALALRVGAAAAAPMVVHVQGDSTEGFKAFGGLADVLTEDDVLVVSCEAEAAASRHCFPRARIHVVPFPLVDRFRLVRPGGTRPDAGAGTARLAFVGRVSEQKNLHTLLFALWLLRTRYDDAPRITLDVYGREDGLGSPNMGITFPGYGEYLQRLAELLGLDHLVTWHGFKTRDWLFENVHLEPHVFVSPTLHSDENFGSSVLASLVNGHQVVTTAWGGHLGFREWFRRQLTLVPVHGSALGPVVDPVLLADAVLRAVRATAAPVDDDALDRARREFSQGRATARMLDVLRGATGDGRVPLAKSAVLRDLDERRARYGGTRRIYADYADPAARIFFEAYGMTEPLVVRDDASYVLAPWVTRADGAVRVADPHRGPRTFALDAHDGDPTDVAQCPGPAPCRLPEDLLATLAAHGYAFALPPAR